jgi:hypothetical protein
MESFVAALALKGGDFDRHLSCNDELAIRLEEQSSGTNAIESRKGKWSLEPVEVLVLDLARDGLPGLPDESSRTGSQERNTPPGLEG